MRENHPIDDLFRESISTYEISPLENVWNSLNKKLQAKDGPVKSRKINKPVFVSAAILVSLAAFFTYYLIAPKQTQQKKEIAQVATTTSNPVLPVQTDVVSAKNESVSAKKENATTVKTNPYEALQNKSITDESKKAISEETNRNSINIQTALLIYGFDKTEIEPIPYTEKKDNSILVMPYFPSDGKQNNVNQNESETAGKSLSKNELTDALNKPDKTESTIYVPNAFTPNGDGLNDMFIPQTAETLKEYKLFIYDKTGNLVFSSDDIHKGWDGHSQINGVETTNTDMYMWRIEMKNSKGEREHLMGYVNLLNDK